MDLGFRVWVWVSCVSVYISGTRVGKGPGLGLGGEGLGDRRSGTRLGPRFGPEHFNPKP